jgi:hypothetical protein
VQGLIRSRATLNLLVINKNRALSKSFANELNQVFNIDEGPLVGELESSLREKSNPFLTRTNFRNQRLSMQTNELEMLSRRIREAEERLRRVEEENEEGTSQGQPTPPISPGKPLSTNQMSSPENRPEDNTHQVLE